MRKGLAPTLGAPVVCVNIALSSKAELEDNGATVIVRLEPAHDPELPLC